MSHLCCSILVCSVAPDIAFISPLSRSYGANESEHERKSGVYHMHMRSHLQHKQLRTELPKDVRAALVTLEQMTATNRVVGSRVCMHVEHVALALVLANCVVCTLVFSTSGDLIKANIDRSLQSRTHQMCVKAQIFTDKVVLSLDGGDVLTVVNSMRDKAKRLFLPTKSQYGLHRFVRFPGDRGKYVSFNALSTMLVVGDLHTLQLYKFMHDVVRSTQISAANKDDMNVNKLSLGRDSGLALYEVARVKITTRAILFAQFSAHRHMPNTLLVVSQDEETKSATFGQLYVQYWRYRSDQQCVDMVAELVVGAGSAQQDDNDEPERLDWADGAICSPDGIARNHRESRVLVCFRDGSLVLVAANPFLAEEGSTADRSRPQTNSMAPNDPSSSPHSLAQVARVTLQPHLGAPAFAVWHPSDTFVLVFCKNGEVIALDTALQPLFFLDQQGGLDPKPLRLTSVLGFDASVAPKVTSAVWGHEAEPERGCACDKTHTVCEEPSFGCCHLAVTLEGGPLLVLHFKTGFRTKIEPLALLGHRLANGEVYCAIGMLYQMDRDYHTALTMVCNCLFRMDSATTVKPCASRVKNDVLLRGDTHQHTNKRPLQLLADVLHIFWRRYDLLHAESQHEHTLSNNTPQEDSKFVDLFEVLNVLYTRLFYALLLCDFVDDAFTVARRLKRTYLFHDLYAFAKDAKLEHVAQLSKQALDRVSSN